MSEPATDTDADAESEPGPEYPLPEDGVMVVSPRGWTVVEADSLKDDAVEAATRDLADHGNNVARFNADAHPRNPDVEMVEDGFEIEMGIRAALEEYRDHLRECGVEVGL